MTDWVDACAVDDVEEEDVVRFDHAGQTYALYLSPEGTFHCTDGLCSHEQAHLAGGLVTGHLVECPRHGGQFDYRTGAARQAPACENLRTYPVQIEEGRVLVQI